MIAARILAAAVIASLALLTLVSLRAAYDATAISKRRYRAHAVLVCVLTVALLWSLVP